MTLALINATAQSCTFSTDLQAIIEMIKLLN